MLMIDQTHKLRRLQFTVRISSNQLKNLATLRNCPNIMMELCGLSEISTYLVQMSTRFLWQLIDIVHTSLFRDLDLRWLFF